MISDTLNTLRKKLQEPETRTIIIDNCAEEIDEIIENRTVLLDFSEKFQDDISRFNKHKSEYLRKKKGIFETLPLNKKQIKSKKWDYTLCSYKYKKNGKNNKNIRCIFIIDKDNDWNIFVHSFVEKETKDYNKAIDKAIKRCNEELE